MTTEKILKEILEELKKQTRMLEEITAPKHSRENKKE